MRRDAPSRAEWAHASSSRPARRASWWVLSLIPVMWLIFAVAGRPLIALLYSGQAPLHCLNSVIEGQATHPLSHYVDYASQLLTWVTLVLAGLGTFLWSVGAGLLRWYDLIWMVIGFVHLAAFAPWTVDDAYITFAFAKNIAAGNGPVLCPGLRVEATSSLLWAFLLAPFELAGWGAVVGSKILGIVSFFADVLVARRIVVRLLPVGTPRAPYQFAASLLLTASSPFVCWSVTGMENAAAALLLLVSVDQLLREYRRGRGLLSVIPVASLMLVRPEGFMFVLAFLVWRIILWWVQPSRERWWLASWALCLAGIVVPVKAATYWYYGGMIANSAAAKVGALGWDRCLAGLAYLLHPSSFIPVALFVVALALLGLGAWRGIVRQSLAWRPFLLASVPFLLIASLVGLQFAFVCLVGGDFMANSRFLAHIVPLVCLLAVLQAVWLLGNAPGTQGACQRTTIALSCLVCVLGLLQSVPQRRFFQMAHYSQERALRATALFLNDRATSTDTVACADIGMISYYFKGRVLDWWGLADREVVRLRQGMGRIAPQTVLRRRPRFIVLYSTRSTLTPLSVSKGWSRVSARFLADHDFVECYKEIASFQYSGDLFHIVFERQCGVTVPGGIMTPIWQGGRVTQSPASSQGAGPILRSRFYTGTCGHGA